MEDPHAGYFEWLYKKTLHRALTNDWHLLQGPCDQVAVKMWVDVMKLLELDRKAQREMFLLAYSGPKGRTMANKFLHELLLQHATKDPAYRNLSSLVTSTIASMRKHLDRPPWFSEDMPDWDWWFLDYVRWGDRPWAPDEVPANLSLPHATGRNGEPLPPPQLW